MSAYKKFIVTVEILRYDGKRDHDISLTVKAQSAEEADAIVHNRMVFAHEPKFRITKVKEVEE